MLFIQLYNKVYHNQYRHCRKRRKTLALQQGKCKEKKNKTKNNNNITNQNKTQRRTKSGSRMVTTEQHLKLSDQQIKKNQV